MPNTDTPFGLKPVKHWSSSGFNPTLVYCSIPASDGTALFKGDAVKLTGSGDVDGVPGVIQVAAGDTIFGVIHSFELDPTNLELNHRIASTLRYGYVIVDPEMIYEIQEDSVGGALAAANIGQNADIAVAAGSPVAGISGMELDSSSAGTGTAQLRILEVVQRPDNEIGVNAKILVRINEHRFNTATGV